MKVLIKAFSVITLSFSLLTTVSAETDWENVAGTTIGTVLGGVIGYQFGGGTGKYVATAAGAVIGGAVGNRVSGGDGFGFRDPVETYKSEYVYPADGQGNQPVYVGEDDYLIKQRLSDAAKRRNMIRNGEADPYELPHDISNTQTSWDDPFN
ncbi:MAG: glycine zipper 2TM domain-containing protein [gamma proteobacterium symbiont of Taylorina sp.]|nr:glycine zipper 2TM domain-containing protein [gamma proteobacterium symbiont of Taylorina sp.]